jgi:hypothetical protein
MGNILSNKTESLKWNDIDTNDMSSEKIFKNTNRHKVERLINDLEKSIQQSQLSDSINEIFNTKYDNLPSMQSNSFITSNKTNNTNNNVESLSSTSPFISEEIYKSIMKSNNQQGGAKKNDSSTSTSSSSNSKKQSGGKINRNEIHSLDSLGTSSPEGSDVSTNFSKLDNSSNSEDLHNNIDYISSSAHTQGEYSQFQSDSVNSTSRSMHGNIESPSIHTSEINMVNI